MREKQKKRRRIHPYGQRLLVPIFLLLISASCSSNAPTSILVREPLQVPSTVNDIFARDGKSDYLLMADDGYSFRLIYLCENRVLNFIDEPENNPVLVSVQPVLDTAVEGRLSPDDRRRIWACMERRVLEEKSRVDEIKSRVVRDRAQVDNEARSVRAEMERRISEIAERKRLEAENQRRAEEEKRRAEEERLRKSQEDQRKAADEEKKLRAYKVSEREDPAPPAAPLKATETGVFLIMNEARLHEEPSEFSRVVTRSAKYDVLEVLNSRKDPAGNYWHQVYLGERLVSDRGKRSGWSPEERSFWVKNRLPVWVYPGDIASVHQAKPIRLKVDDVQFTGRTAPTPQKTVLYEVAYSVNHQVREAILAWVEERNGIRRTNKSKEDMKNVLRELSKTVWPTRIQEDVLRGYIRPGFNRDQVLVSWGTPDHVNSTRIFGGNHEQWVYGEPPFPKSYVYFENGVVKSWEYISNGEKKN